MIVNPPRKPRKFGKPKQPTPFQKYRLRAIGIIKHYFIDKKIPIENMTDAEIICKFASDKYDDTFLFSGNVARCLDWLNSKMRCGDIDSLKTSYKEVDRSVYKKPKKEIKKKEKVKKDIRVDYLKFLTTPYWQEVRAMVLNRDGCKCVVCGVKTGLQIHHTSYKHHFHEMEYLNDLVTLCGGCHKEEHERLKALSLTENL